MAMDGTNSYSTVHPSPNSGADQGSSRGRGWLLLLVLLIVAVLLVLWGIVKRKKDARELASYTNENALPTVSLTAPTLEAGKQEIVLPGNMQAYTMAPIYARATGYVKSWSHDIGSHVRRGELLAVIETPELDKQLAQAKADLQTARVNAGLAKITATRYNDLIGDKAVSQQDTDNAENQLRASNSQVVSAEANVQRLEELQSFERIVAPFDGVITARNLDVGQLIGANGSTITTGAGIVDGSKQVFTLSKIDKLRVFINVPQQYVTEARNGTTATLTLPQYPGRSFTGVLVRSSQAVDPASRTLLAEVDVDNRSGELLPGSYAEVHLHVQNPVAVKVVPASALILLPDGMHVATIDDQHRIHMPQVVLGRDQGKTAEVVSGLPEGAKVVSNPPDSLTEGEQVRVMSSSSESLGQQP